MSILDDLRAVIEQTKPELYYSVSDQIEVGKTIRIAAHGIWPNVWLFHPDDWPNIRPQLAPHCRLRDFHEWQPSQEDVQKDVAAHFESLLGQPIEYRETESFRINRRYGWRI